MSDLSTDGLNRSLTNATALYPMNQGCFHVVHILSLHKNGDNKPLYHLKPMHVSD